MPLRPLLMLSLFGALVQAPSFARAPAASSDKAGTPVVIVELFTSEGCSSCPPADKLLRDVHLQHTRDGELIVGISEHVTYWNRLGWQDPFSANVFTERQEAYAGRLSSEGPYTPEMVVNGEIGFVGSDTAALQSALHTATTRPHLDLTIQSVMKVGNQLSFSVALKSHPERPVDLFAVVTDDAVRSNVLRGENSGRFLEHVSVARWLTRVATLNDKAELREAIDLPGSLHLSAGSGHHLILFAQEEHQGRIVAAAAAEI